MEDNSNTINDKNNDTNIKIKRVRKSKKQMQQEKNSIQNSNIENISNTDLVLELDLTNTINENIVVNENEVTAETAEKVHKKRGRKPKGGKIIQQITPLNDIKETKPNIILNKFNNINNFCIGLYMISHLVLRSNCKLYQISIFIKSLPANYFVPPVAHLMTPQHFDIG